MKGSREMNLLRKMRVRSRLAIGFGLLAVAMIAVGVFGLTRVSALNAQLDHTVNVRMKLFQSITGMLEVSHHNARYRNQMFIESDPQTVEKLRALQKENQKRNNEYQKTIE